VTWADRVRPPPTATDRSATHRPKSLEGPCERRRTHAWNLRTPPTRIDLARSQSYKDCGMTEEERSKAIRLARAIASDISLYNEQKIIKGIEQDNLFDVLKDEIDEGRELYKSRVSGEILKSTNFFERAIVDIVVRSKAHVRSRIW
jgi:hypothetical protein